VTLSWTNGVAPYVVQRADQLALSNWTTLLTTNAQSVTLPATNLSGYFRVLGQ
jgi:hypothetical protein